MSFKTNYIHSKANSSFQSISKYLNLYFSFVVITFTLLQLTSAEDDVTFASSSSSSSDNNELMFHQIEGLMIDRSVSVANLISAMKIALSEIFGREIT